MAIKVKEGMRVPADCILIEAESPMIVREISETGEPDEFEKIPYNESSPLGNYCHFLVGQSYIMKGSGQAVVCSVGKNCRYQILPETVNINYENEDTKP
jgi:magnesium-transporting ATPase (P-type)